MNPETRRRSNPTDPPRAVPLLVRLRLMFGGTITQLGWAFFAFGMIFCWIFVANSDLTSWYWFRGPLATAQGQVTDLSKTRFSQGEDGAGPIFAISYRFDYNDAVYTDTSYVTDQELRPPHDVKVEFPPGHPAVSRIVGMRRAPCEAWAIFVIIFPLAGLGCLLPGLVGGWRAAWLLANGRPTIAKLVGKEQTSMRVNDRVVYRMVLEYLDPNSRLHRLTVRTSKPSSLEDSDPIWVLYDPSRPNRAVAIADQPGRPFIDPQTGQVLQKDPAHNLRVLILPGVTLLYNAVWIVIRSL